MTTTTGATDKTVEALILDLLDWLAARERTYQEVIEVWRTSCPRLPVWEEANDCGFIKKEVVDGREFVKLTPAGLDFLQLRSRR